VVEARAFRAAHRQARLVGRSRAQAAASGLEAVWPPVVVRLARAEIGLFRSLWWAVRGRRAVREGELPLPYADRFTVMLWAICCLGALELGVVHVLTARWPAARWALFAPGVYALLWVLGFGCPCASTRTSSATACSCCGSGTSGARGCPSSD
jgi:hypothetical protein